MQSPAYPSPNNSTIGRRFQRSHFFSFKLLFAIWDFQFPEIVFRICLAVFLSFYRRTIFGTRRQIRFRVKATLTRRTTINKSQYNRLLLIQTINSKTITRSVFKSVINLRPTSGQRCTSGINKNKQTWRGNTRRIELQQLIF